MEKKYFYKKYVESIIFDPKFNEKLRAGKLDKQLNIKFLMYLNNYLELNRNHIDETIKNKLYEIIRYIRFNKNQNNEDEYNILLNNVIAKINQASQEDILGFYYNQANARAHDSRSVRQSDKMDSLLGLYEQICYSISYDFQVLCDLCKTPEEYEKVIKKYLADGWFISSVKGIYHENAKIFNDPKIIENLTQVIIANEKILKSKSTLQEGNNDIKEKILRR